MFYGFNNQFIFEHSLDAIVILNHLNWVEGNASFLGLFGIKKEQLSNSHFIDYLVSEDREVFFASYQNAIRLKQTEFALELRIQNYKAEKIETRLNFFRQTPDQENFLVIIHDESSVKMKERYLSEREERLKDSHRLAKIGEWQWELKTGKLSCSDMVYELLDLPRNSRLTMDLFFSRVHPSDRELVKDEIENALTLKNVSGVEYRVVHRNGLILNLLSHFDWVKDQNNQFLSLKLIIQDMTEIKKNEERISHLQNMLLEAGKIAHIGGLEIDIKTLQVIFTPEVYDILELDDQFEPSIKNFSSLCTEASCQEFNKAFNELLNYGESLDLELEVVTLRHNRKWIHMIGKPFLENKKFVKISGMIHDISEHKLANQKLRESEERFKAFMDNLPANAFIKDKNSAIIYANPSMLKDFIKPSWIGEPQQVYLSQDFSEKIRLDDQDILENGAKFVEEKLINLQEIEHVYATYKFPILLTGKDPLIGGISFNISERKRIEEEKEKYLQALNEKKQEMENILFVTTHDLRTPLVNIQGFAKLLKDYLIDLEKQTETMNFPASARQILGEEIPEALTYILAGASKMNALINGLLRISRTGNMELKIEKISITEIIAGIMEVINFQVQEHRVSVQIEELPTCIGDREMISQLFSNIIDNAIKYKKENLPLVIAIKGKVQEQHVLYEVRDNGQGLKKDQVQKVFELFYRFEQKNKVQGEGLGLTLSKKIMDRHHGKIWVESEEGHGCSFFIQFPLVYAQQD